MTRAQELLGQVEAAVQALKAELGTPTPASPTVPLTYNARIDRVVQMPTLVPAPLAGAEITDTFFGCRVHRVTDGNTAPPLNYSFRTPSAPNQSGWAPDSKRFYVLNDQATVHVFRFDSATRQTTFERTVTSGLEPAFPRVATKPDTLYVVRWINFHVIDVYDFATGQFTPLLDLKAVDPSLNNTLYTSSIYVSGGLPERMAVLYGGSNQDLHMKVTVFDVDTPKNLVTINTLDSTVNGKPAMNTDGTPATVAIRLHSIAISHDGNTVALDPVGTSAYYWQFDVPSKTFTKVTNRTGGHRAMGWDRLVNEDATGSAKMQWQARDLANPHAPSQRITTIQQNVKRAGDHTSWANARSAADRMAPFFSECQTLETDPWNYWFNEILAVASDGPEQVWRFCHHHCRALGDVTPTIYPFQYQPLAQVDPSGRFVMFTSNWEKTLGAHAAPASPEATRRTDVFIVELNRGGA